MKPEPLVVTATEANRRFSALLREVANGTPVVVTSRGQAIARIQPETSSASDGDKERRVELEKMFEALDELRRLASERFDPPPVWKFNRDEIYDDDF
jgi:prevent-host-death family protein